MSFLAGILLGIALHYWYVNRHTDDGPAGV